MDIKVKGLQKLSGEVTPSGSKNSVVALIPSTILFDKPVVLKNVPNITDVSRLVNILSKLGSKIVWDKEQNSLSIDNSELKFENLDREDLGNMKGTSLLWGPMLARFGKVNFTELPGGCTLGVRSLGPQFDAFREIGVEVNGGNHQAKMDATGATAKEVWLAEMSPTITENLIMFASGLKGTTKIIGAASEPQVQDLCHFLTASGAKISGVGSSVLTIEGGVYLEPKEHTLFPDHYEIATFIAMTAATGGNIKIHNSMPHLFKHINHVFSQFGVEVNYSGDTAIFETHKELEIAATEKNRALQVKAQPWPSLPVDLLPVFIPLALAAKKGQVMFHNWMYEAGLFWTSELQKIGANIIMCDPHRVLVTSGNKLYGDTLEAPYIIRAVVALVISAMIAEGESTILNADALYRGHPHFSDNLRRLGAKIEEING